MTSLADRLDQDNAPSWRPDDAKAEGVHDNPLIGKFVGMDQGSTSYGPCWIMTVEQEGGDEVAVWLFHEVLKNELARAKPQPGETIGIKYVGKTKPKGGGNEFHNYRVKVDRAAADQDFNWGRLGVETGLVDDAAATDGQTADAAKAEDDIPF